MLGRLADRIWSSGVNNLSIGMSIAHVFYSGNTAGGGTQTLNLQDRPQIRVDGTRLISTSGIAAKTADMIAFDMGGNYENFFLGGEWARVHRRPPVRQHHGGGQCALAQQHAR